ncbi:MAG TPA: hypothetical protein VGV64_07950 [Thermoplasmata archaeon]|nr:hypothetical protein [Thermoplasmata archaeon]
MRRSIVILTALAAVLTASSFLVPIADGRAVGPSPSAASTPAVAGFTVSTENQFGFTQNHFEPGLTSGKIYFHVTDASGDASANISVYSKNTSRDGVGAPAYHLNVKFSGGQNNSYLWNNFYLLPVNLTYGGLWNVTVTAPKGGFAWADFNVSTYFVDAQISPGASLPAHNLSLSYLASRSSNNAVYTSLTQLTVTGLYYGNGGKLLVIPGTPSKLTTTAGIGWYNFSAPTDASGDLFITLYANVTSAGVTLNQTATATAVIGHIGTPQVLLSSCPTTCYTSSFPAGTPVFVFIHATIAGASNAPAPGLTAAIKFQRNATFVSPPGNPPTTVLTDRLGAASFSFIASSSSFSTKTNNAVSVTVSDLADPSDTSQTTNASFTIFNVTNTPHLIVAFSQSEYYAGDSASFTWSLGAVNATVLKGWSGDHWSASVGGIALVAGFGTLPAASTTGTVTFRLPVSVHGTLSVGVVAVNSTESINGNAVAAVAQPSILLTASETTYLPGDTIHFSITLAGSVLSGASLSMTIRDGSGEWIANGPVSGNSIQLNIPTAAPANTYTLTVFAESASLGYIANGTISVNEANGIDLILGVSSPSNYADGSYQPGQSVTLNYQFLVRGTAAPANVYQITLYPYAAASTGRDTSSVGVSSSSGSFSYTVPSDSPSGPLLIYAFASIGGSSCVTNCRAVTYLSIDVNRNPAPLAYQFGNSGFTAGSLVLLVLIILVALVMIWMWRRGGRPMMMKPESGSTSPGSHSGSSMSGSGSGGSTTPGGEASK